MGILNIFSLLIFCSQVTATKSVNSQIVITPKVINKSNSRLRNGSDLKQISLVYEHNNKDVILDLELNDNIIPKEHFLSFQEPNGDKAVKNTTDKDFCHYHVSNSVSKKESKTLRGITFQGKIRNNSQSSVALSTCDGVRGVVFDGHDTFYIENETNGPQGKHFLIR
jgi:Reprolysin family propeptide